MAKYVYFFGGGKADGNESMKNLLGGKGANLAEMAGHPALRLPVPPGFTITTEVCTYYYDHKRTYPKELKTQGEKALAQVEKLMGKKFGDPGESAARLGALRRAPLHARHDGHGAQRRPERRDHPGPDRADRQRALRLRRLPPADHDVRRRGDGEGRRHRAEGRQGHPQDPRRAAGASQAARRATRATPT